jgi:hypothetical protein
MEAKHTPGPWKATHIGDGEYRREIVVDIKNCGQICAVLDDGNGREDARLIAAAPELYEALNALIRGPGLCGPEEWRTKCLRDAIGKGVAALTKAEGR